MTRSLLPGMTCLSLLCLLPLPYAHAQSTSPSAQMDTVPPAPMSAATPPVLMPTPSTLRSSGEAFPLPSRLDIHWDSPATPALRQAVQRLEQRLAVLTAPQGTENTQSAPYAVHIHYRQDAPFPRPAMREEYDLRTSATEARLDAQEPAGILRALATLLQLVRIEASGPVIAQASITDSPRFVWRGLMIDTSRHFMPLPALLRQLDAMEMVKLNVLHLHLSDGAAFRVESRLYPLLTRSSNRDSPRDYYTQDEIRQLVRAAAERGIRVVPEFDTPGHTFAILRAYPALAAQHPLNKTDRAEINRAAMDPTNPATLLFVNRLYTEMARLFPDPVFHIGGDEVVARQWLQNPRIAAYMKQHKLADTAALQAGFSRQVGMALHARGKTVMGWDEILAADLPPGTLIQSWRGPAHTLDATRAGYGTVISGSYYLDRLLPARAYYETDPLDTRKGAAEAAAAAQTTGPGGTAPAPLAPSAPPDTRQAADDTPLPPLSTEQAAHVLGAEAVLWTEVINENMLDARLWPRTAALAERFWSPAAQCRGETLAPRLAVMRDRLDLLGLRATQQTLAGLERMAPGETGAAQILLSAVSPVRNYAHNHEFLQIRHKETATEQPLDTLADIAMPDTPLADLFNAEVAAFIAGETALKPDLIRMLTLWAENDEAFQRAAAHHPALTTGLAASAELAALARAGLAALGQGRPPGWREQARAALDTAQADIAASASIHVVTHARQPTGDLIQRITPGIALLAEQDRP